MTPKNYFIRWIKRCIIEIANGRPIGSGRPFKPQRQIKKMTWMKTPKSFLFWSGNSSMQGQTNACKLNDEKNRIYRLELALPKQTYLASYPQKM
ncbi:hypothetical protein GALL_217190 [mine drainage metagenome]|uniref:Uncharacterized protein n=1 Tax=mine drainage metagenome TaxID=410659 RepID=A0A1J5RJI8_9ZZZZ